MLAVIILFCLLSHGPSGWSGSSWSPHFKAGWRDWFGQQVYQDLLENIEETDTEFWAHVVDGSDNAAVHSHNEFSNSLDAPPSLAPNEASAHALAVMG